MPIGTSIFLIAAGAILRYAVNADISGLEISTVGDDAATPVGPLQQALAADPINDHLWRFEMRRLSAAATKLPLRLRQTGIVEMRKPLVVIILQG